MKKIYYYSTYEDDIIKSSNQDYKLKDNYKWIHTNIFYKILSFILHIFIIIFSFLYSKLYLRIKIKNKKLLKHEKSYFLYCNHTQMLGDVLNPFLICLPKHPYIICSASNLGIPFIGKLLPMAGALPIPNNIHGLIKFKDAIKYYAKNNPIIIYPEAHLWPYATFIREFPTTSFHYPVEENKKIFTATTTYTKSKIFKRPNIVIYIDGPFTSNKELSKKENIKSLHDKVYETMQKRSKLNNYEYVTYKKKA